MHLKNRSPALCFIVPIDQIRRVLKKHMRLFQPERCIARGSRRAQNSANAASFVLKICDNTAKTGK